MGEADDPDRARRLGRLRGLDCGKAAHRRVMLASMHDDELDMLAEIMNRHDPGLFRNGRETLAEWADRSDPGLFRRSFEILWRDCGA